MRHPLTFACLACLACLAAAPSLASAATVWTATSVEKIRPDAPARASASAAISAARNEFEAFQVVVTGAASGVSATASDLVGPAVIPASGARLYREALIDLSSPSALDGATGRFPDALVPDVDDVVGERRNAFPFDVPAGESRAIWVEVLVPADAPPGDYQGAITVHAAAGDTVVPVTLTVWNFGLPSTPTLRSWFGLSYPALPAAHGVSGDAFSALRARYSQLALDHRISLGKYDDGNTDLAHFDRYYGALLDGTAPTRLAGARLTSISYGGDLLSTSQLSSWAQHFRARRWFDRLFQYTCDEPPITCGWSDIPARAAAARAADPGFRTLVTTPIQDATQNGVASSINLMTPVVNELDDKPGQTLAGPQSSAYQAFRSQAPNELWTYQSCMSHGCGGTSGYFTGWPSVMIDASAARNRSLEWLSFRFGVTGELYWDTTYAYTASPTGDAWTSQWGFSGNGDGTLFYPGTPARIGGTTDIPVSSIRLKMIREGVEDYEYLARVARDGDPAFAMQVAASLFPNAWTTDPGPDALLAARARLARRILELENGGTPPGSDPATGSGTGALHASCDTAGTTPGIVAGLLALGLAVGVTRRRRSRG